MPDKTEDMSISRANLEMITVANEFCHYLETCEKRKKRDIFELINRILPLLYIKGSLLPEIEVEDPDANERFLTEEEWENIFTLLRNKFGKEDEFWFIDPLHIDETEPLKASIAENITDIYQDMKDLILLYQKNTMAARQNAISECRKLFATNWGYKITNIMSRLHHLLNEDTDETDKLGSPYNFL